MTTVKDRVTKKCHSDPRITVDAIHTEMIKNLSEEEKLEYYLDNGMLLNEYYDKGKKTDNTQYDFRFSLRVISYPEDQEKTKNITQQYIENIDDSVFDITPLERN